MSDRQLELAERRSALLAQSTAQRQQLESLAGDIKERLAGVDRGLDVARSIARHPAVVVGAAAMVAFIGPRRLVRALARSAMFITTGRRILNLLRSSRARPNRLALPRD
jgi:uncharacterized membrane-anchored protein